MLSIVSVTSQWHFEETTMDVHVPHNSNAFASVVRESIVMISPSIMGPKSVNRDDRGLRRDNSRYD